MVRLESLTYTRRPGSVGRAGFAAGRSGRSFSCACRQMRAATESGAGSG